MNNVGGTTLFFPVMNNIATSCPFLDMYATLYNLNVFKCNTTTIFFCLHKYTDPQQHVPHVTLPEDGSLGQTFMINSP